MKTEGIHRGWQAGAFALVLVLAGCGGDAPTEASRPSVPPLARVGDRVLDEAGFESELARWRAARRPVTTAEQVVREWVERESLLKRAMEMGLADDPAVRRDLDQLLVQRWLERELQPGLDAMEVSTEEVKAEYDRDVARFTQPARVRLAVLFQEAPRRSGEASRDEARSRLESARQRVLEDPPLGGRGPAAGGFGAMAAEVSDDQASRYRGGDLGWLEPGRFDYRWPRVVLETGYALEVGEISGLLETETGFYLVRKTDERASTVIPLEQVESQLRQTLLVRRRQEREAAFRQEATRQAGAWMDVEALAQRMLPAATTNVARREESQPPGVPGTAQPN
jgi:hypothetical protein